MIRKVQLVVIAAIAAIVAVASAAPFVSSAAGRGGSQSDLARVKASVARYHTTAAAEAAGWGLVPGLDSCFELPGTGGMGIHYINTDLLDTALDPSQPEALVYQQMPNGTLHLGAVEYIVPADAWDATHTGLPVIHGLQPEDMSLHLNAALGVYVLHAWIFEKNPAGTFADWNPDVSCLPGTGMTHAMP
jgi:hypothetical protein